MANNLDALIKEKVAYDVTEINTCGALVALNPTYTYLRALLKGQRDYLVKRNKEWTYDVSALIYDMKDWIIAIQDYDYENWLEPRYFGVTYSDKGNPILVLKLARKGREDGYYFSLYYDVSKGNNIFEHTLSELI